jgi:hypothetical protein
MFVDYIENTRTNFSLSDLSLLNRLVGKGIVGNELIIKVINEYIKQVNDVSLNSDTGIVLYLDKIENLVKHLGELMSFVDDAQKVKVKEMQKKILHVKRNLLANEKKINSQLNMTTQELQLDTSLIEMIRNDVERNVFNIYVHSRTNYHDVLTSSIESRSENPLSSLISSMQLNSYMKTYEVKTSFEDGFKEYFDILGMEKQKELHKSKKLLNYFESGFYDAFLQHLQTSREISDGLFYSIIDFNKFYSNLRVRLNEILEVDDFNDPVYEIEHILSARIILLIEHQLVALKNYIDGSNVTRINEVDFLVKLFNEIDDISIKDDIFHIYYSIYSKRGTDIRDMVFHGNNIYREYEVYLYRLTSCLVSLSNIQKKVYNG